MLMKNDISQGNMVNLKDIQYPPPFWSKNELYDSGIKGITTIYGIKFLRLKNKTKCILPFIRKSKFIPSFLIPVSLKMIKDMMNQIAQKKEDLQAKTLENENLHAKNSEYQAEIQKSAR